MFDSRVRLQGQWQNRIAEEAGVVLPVRYKLRGEMYTYPAESNCANPRLSLQAFEAHTDVYRFRKAEEQVQILPSAPVLQRSRMYVKIVI